MTLEVEGVCCAYDLGHVLNGVDLTVGDGEIVGLLGRNGMGKTSLVRCISGLRPPRLTAGRIRHDGADVSTMNEYVIARRGLGLVPQGRRVFANLTVVENLTVTARSKGRDGWTAQRIFDLFPRLAERRGHAAKHLSGGEQQMLAIGRALMTNPTLLVMDEASEGLAPAVLVELRDRLLELRGGRMAVLLVEQNARLAASLADRLAVIGGDGTIVWSGTAAEFDTDPAAREHLGV